jgi:uncharacterized membrane protein YdjX (TVP38/TMEM64 family)
MKRALIRIFFAAAVVALIYIGRGLPFAEWLASLESLARQYPLAGAVAYIAVAVVATALLVPGWVMMMLAGLVFGLTLGLAYAMAGLVGGAVVGLFIGRTVARKWVERRIAGNVHLMALDEALEEQAFAIIALTRVALVFPHNVLNYAYGVTRVKLPAYTAGTAVGIFPIVGFYVYLGTLAHDMSQILEEGAQIGLNAWWAIAIAAIAIATVVFVVRRALVRALQRQTRDPETI